LEIYILWGQKSFDLPVKFSRRIECTRLLYEVRALQCIDYSFYVVGNVFFFLLHTFHRI